MTEKTFTVRFTISAAIPEVLLEDDDFDEDAWRQEWEVRVKPGLIRAIFSHLRSVPDWEAHIRNRGVSPLDEIEIVAQRTYQAPPIQ